jgi:hypothetical protein
MRTVVASWNWACSVLDLIGADATRLQVVFITITRDQLTDFSRNIAGDTLTGRRFRARDATRLAVHNSAHFIVVATTIAFNIVVSTVSTVSVIITIKFDSGCGLCL